MLTALLTAIGSLFFFFYLIYKYFSRNGSYWPKRNVQVFQLTKVVSLWDRLSFKYPIQDTENLTYRAIKALGIKDYCGVMEFGKPTLYLMDLDLVKSVMIKDFDSFVNRRGFAVEKTDPLFHNMLINARDQDWKNLRSTLSPTFSTGKIRRMYQCFNESSNKLADFIRKEIQTDSQLDVHDVFTRYTMDVISSAAFGLDSQAFQDGNSVFCKMGKRFQDQFGGWKVLKLFLNFMFPKLYVRLGIPLFDEQASNFFGDALTKALRHREKSGEKREDFLQLLLESRNTKSQEETPAEDAPDQETQLTGKTEKIVMTDELILAQSLLFFVGGFDTTESLILLCAYELAVNPDIQEKLYKELKEASIKNDGELSFDITMKLEYLDKVVSETLRKYPPAVRAERVCTKQYKVPNRDLVIEKDIIVAVQTYGIHHDPEYWPDPEKFDPERFSEKVKATRHPYAYMPFGVGPRNCIAMRFALAEGKAALAHLILDFKLQPGSETQIPIKFTKANMKPEGGLWLDIQSRN